MASGLATITPRNSSIVIDSGEAHFDGGVTCTNTRDAIFSVRGGVVTASSVNFPRTSDATINFERTPDSGRDDDHRVGQPGHGQFLGCYVRGGRLARDNRPIDHRSSGYERARRSVPGHRRRVAGERRRIRRRDVAQPGDQSQQRFTGQLPGRCECDREIHARFRLNSHSRIGHRHSQRRIALPRRRRHRQERLGFATNLNFGNGLLGAKADWATSLPINLPANGALHQGR